MLAGCAAHDPPPAAGGRPSPSATPTSGLAAALIPAPPGMRLAYGPEYGAYGSLQATQRGLAALRQAKLDRPQCAMSGQLDATVPEIGKAPAAVVAFVSDKLSITQALVALPPGKAALPPPVAKECRSYHATIGDAQVRYTTEQVRAPRLGAESRAFVTTTSGGGRRLQIGAGMVRHRNVVMTILLVGSTIKPADLRRNIADAYERLAKVVK
ncbi:hypothetical protein [Thermoactinospora rubra]|uniref:hypothetical protein n=1 Tax=Thermoactinospora rubra TaxID=1088767 RepID=UPI00117C0C89|nr:hypothetical protein [Thermoactinospora rubra]